MQIFRSSWFFGKFSPFLLALTLSLSTAAMPKPERESGSPSGPSWVSRRQLCALALAAVGGGAYFVGRELMSESSPKERWLRARQKIPGLNGRRVEIEFIAQAHREPDGGKSHRWAIESQANILRRVADLSRREPIAVFAEGVNETYTKSMREEARARFPKDFDQLDAREQVDTMNGLIEPLQSAQEQGRLYVLGLSRMVVKGDGEAFLRSLDHLSAKFREMFVIGGAPGVAWAFDFIDTVHAAETEAGARASDRAIAEMQRRGISKILEAPAELRDPVLVDREILALSRIHEFVAQLPMDAPVPRILLAFGAGHDLGQYEDSQLKITRIQTFRDDPFAKR